MVEEYTANAPSSFRCSKCPLNSVKAVKDRWEAFRKAVEAGTASEPLVLTSDDLNALIEQNPELKGKIYVKVEGDEIKGTGEHSTRCRASGRCSRAAI